MFGHFTLPEDSKPLFDTKRYAVMQHRPGAPEEYRTPEGKWSFKKCRAATFLKADAEPLLVNGAYLKEVP